MRLAGSVSRSLAKAVPEPRNGTASVARMWMMPPSSTAPMIVRQLTSVSHLGSLGMTLPAHDSLDRGKRPDGAAFVHGGSVGRVLHGQHQVDAAGAAGG